MRQSGKVNRPFRVESEKQSLEKRGWRGSGAKAAKRSDTRYMVRQKKQGRGEKGVARNTR